MLGLSVARIGPRRLDSANTSKFFVCSKREPWSIMQKRSNRYLPAKRNSTDKTIRTEVSVERTRCNAMYMQAVKIPGAMRHSDWS